MKTKDTGVSQQRRNRRTRSAPSLRISKLGIISRNYQCKFCNGYRDFSHTLVAVLKLMDAQGCDAVLFSLYSIIPRDIYSPLPALKGLKTVKAVFLEEFHDGKRRKPRRYLVYYRTLKRWAEYEFFQVFGSLREKHREDIVEFVRKEMPKRILGNCCVLLCGETNGVKYSKEDKTVHDEFGLKAAIPKDVNIILNPIHDRMTRFEMKLKRQFLSKNGRWVISVWNKGKKDKNGRTRDGLGAAWTIFHNEKEKYVELTPNQLGVEIGILDFSKVI